MASAASEAAIATSRGSARAHSAHDAATAAWLSAIPCAALAAIAILAFGPPLGRVLFPAHGGVTFLPGVLPSVYPEPTEQARYLIAVCAPLLGVLAIATSPRWSMRMSARTAAALVVGTQLALAGLVAAAIVAQYRLQLGAPYTEGEPPFVERYFTPPTLLAAALLAAATTWILRSPAPRRRAAMTLLAESRRRRLLAAGLALAAAAIWVLHAVHSDSELANALEDIRYHLSFVLDEAFAVLNGRTPLVDFSAQYSSLWPFALALPMRAFGPSVLTFTIGLCTLTALALLSIYGVLRRVAGSAAAALLLYLPFLATSLYMLHGTRQDRESVATFYGTMPLRYAAPYFVAWLTARRLDRRRESFAGAWVLFTVAGLGVLNNADFGVPALGAALAALLWTTRPLERRALLRLGGAVAAGVATALALVSALTLVRAGALPQLGKLTEYARIFAVGGFAMLRIPEVLGVALLVYLTYVAAIAVATVRRVRGADGRALTGMLAWAGVFGLGAGSYYVGRSHPDTLPHEFSAWALALALLTIVAVRELAAPRLRPTAIGALVALFGFGVAACSLAQVPTPWEQLARLRAPYVGSGEAPEPNPLVPPRDAATRQFVASLADGPHRFVYKRGAPVAILFVGGHRAADAYGVVNVSPYTGFAMLKTVQQVDAVIAALRRAGGNTVIIRGGNSLGIYRLLERNGFALVTAGGLRRVGVDRSTAPPLTRQWPGDVVLTKWVDLHHLHPRALAPSR